MRWLDHPTSGQPPAAETSQNSPAPQARNQSSLSFWRSLESQAGQGVPSTKIEYDGKANVNPSKTFPVSRKEATSHTAVQSHACIASNKHPWRPPSSLASSSSPHPLPPLPLHLPSSANTNIQETPRRSEAATGAIAVAAAAKP